MEGNKNGPRFGMTAWQFSLLAKDCKGLVVNIIGEEQADVAWSKATRDNSASLGGLSYRAFLEALMWLAISAFPGVDAGILSALRVYFQT